MSINENQEFEAINQKTGERNFIAETECQCKEEYHRVKKEKAQKKAIVLMFVNFVVCAAATLGICALEYIGWINSTFAIVLMCLAGAVTMFKTGYLLHEIKN